VKQKFYNRAKANANDPLAGLKAVCKQHSKHIVYFIEKMRNLPESESTCKRKVDGDQKAVAKLHVSLYVKVTFAFLVNHKFCHSAKAKVNDTLAGLKARCK